MGRPIEWTKKRKAALLADFLTYIEESDIPIIAEFCYKHDVRRAFLYETPEFSYAIERCIGKKEAQLESLGLTNQINVSMAQLSLKQLGWKEKTEVSGPDNGPIGFKFVDPPNTSTK